MPNPADDDISKVIAHIDAHVPMESWVQHPGGWPAAAELALLDSVFSLRAVYGSPSVNDGGARQSATGVWAVIERWRQHRGTELPNDLRQLAKMTEGDLAETVNNRQLTGGRSKAGAVIEAAGLLADRGMYSAEALVADRLVTWRAVLSVRGIGHAAANYFLMLLGSPGVKADVMIQRFVTLAIGTAHPVDPKHAEELLIAAAERIQARTPAMSDNFLRDLDHNIWRFQRSQPTKQR